MKCRGASMLDILLIIICSFVAGLFVGSKKFREFVGF